VPQTQSADGGGDGAGAESHLSRQPSWRRGDNRAERGTAGERIPLAGRAASRQFPRAQPHHRGAERLHRGGGVGREGWGIGHRVAGAGLQPRRVCRARARAGRLFGGLQPFDSRQSGGLDHERRRFDCGDAVGRRGAGASPAGTVCGAERVREQVGQPDEDARRHANQRHRDRRRDAAVQGDEHAGGPGVPRRRPLHAGLPLRLG